MPSLTLTFSAPLNVSCQVGDYAYYITTSSDGGFLVNSDSVTEIGQIREITNPTSNSPTVICGMQACPGRPGTIMPDTFLAHVLYY